MGNHRNSSFIKHAVGTFAALTVVVVSILLAFAAVAPNSHRRGPPVESKSVIKSYAPQASSLIASDSDLPSAFVGRPLFPFSVVPGGVVSTRELINAMSNDPMIARHYAGFDVRAARIVMLRQDLRAYVSYRIGGDIYWSKKQITLHKNETVITDGNIVARTRCGNRVSETFQLPISTREPSPEALDVPQIPETASLSIDYAEPAAIGVQRRHRFGQSGHSAVYLGTESSWRANTPAPSPYSTSASDCHTGARHGSIPYFGAFGGMFVGEVLWDAT